MRLFVVPCALLFALALTGRVHHAILAGLGVLLYASNFRWNKQFREYLGSNALREAVFKVGLAVVALCLLNGKSISSYDNYGVGLTAANLVQRGKVELSPLFQCGNVQEYYVRCRPDGAYTVYPLGDLVLALPTFALGRMLFADLDNHKTIWRLSKLTAALTAGVCAGLFFLIALSLGSRASAVVATVWLATGSALFSTIGQGLWSHDGVLLFFLIAFYLLVRRPPVSDLAFGLTFGLCLSLMFASRVTSAVLILPLGVWLLTQSRRRAVIAGLSAILFFLPWALFHYRFFGNFMGPQYSIAAENAGLISVANYRTSLYGLLLSPGTGLFVYQPWAVLLLVGFAVKKNAHAMWFWALCAAQLALMGMWREWTGQICWGTRYLTEIIPVIGLLVLPAIDYLRGKRMGKAVLIALGVLAFLIQANGVFGPGMNWYYHPINPAEKIEERAMDWRDPAFAYPLFRR